MSGEVPFERFLRDPFALPNPFVLLHAAPDEDGAALSARGKELQFGAVTDQEGEHLRDALRDLTASPLRRIEWEVFTPQASCGTGNADFGTITLALGQLLFGGEAAPSEVGGGLDRFICYLRWDELWQREGRCPLTNGLLHEWWRIATHRHADQWQYWHQLALLYHRQASAVEYDIAAAESACSMGRFTAVSDTSRLEALWHRADRCWAETLRRGEIWTEIHRHVQGMAGFRHAIIDECRQQFPRRLMDMKLARIEQAIRSRNRLTVARHGRYLASLANDATIEPLREEARQAQERLQHRLWPEVRRLSEDHSARFEKLLAGLLLIAPDDMDVLMEAFSTLVAQGNVEQSEQQIMRTGDWTNSLIMARSLTKPAETLTRHVFPNFPRTEYINPSAVRSRWPLQGLQWYYGFLAAKEDRLSFQDHLRHQQLAARLEEALHDQ